MSTVDNPDLYSIGDVIRFFIRIMKSLLKAWWVYLIVIIPLSAIFYIKAINQEIAYSSNLKFYIDGSSGSSGGLLGGLLGNIGSSSNSEVNPFTIVEIFYTYNFLINLAFSESECENKLLANEIIDAYDFDEFWKESSPYLVGFRFTSANFEEFNEQERRVLRKVIKEIVGTEKDRQDAILNIKVKEETGIIKINGESRKECVTLSLINNSYNLLKDHIDEKSFDKLNRRSEIMRFKIDSLNALITSKLLEAAVFEDRNFNIVSKSTGVKKAKLQSEAQALSFALGEAMKQYEISDIQRKDFEPGLILLQRPYYPLIPSSKPIILYLGIAILLGLFLTTIFILGRKVIIQAVNEK